jgi:hypothetical protein
MNRVNLKAIQYTKTEVVVGRQHYLLELECIQTGNVFYERVHLQELEVGSVNMVNLNRLILSLEYDPFVNKVIMVATPLPSET